MKKVSKRLSWEILKGSFVSVTGFLVLLGAYIFYKIQLFPEISEGLQIELKKYIATIFIISVSWIIQKTAGAILRWYARNVVSSTRTELDDRLIPLLRRTLKIIIWIIALVIALPLYGVNISALIATLGVTSLAIALAAQDTIANIISGFLIMVDSPFRIGDRIKLPSGEIVQVMDIGVRRSTFLSDDKKAVIMVPNLDLSKSKIENYTYAESVTK